MKNCNRGTALERSVENLLGRLECLNQFHLNETSPLILMQEVTKVVSLLKFQKIFPSAPSPQQRKLVAYIRRFIYSHLAIRVLFSCHGLYYMDRVKRKSAFEHAQNAQIQIIRRMHEVSSGTLLSSHTFCIN